MGLLLFVFNLFTDIFLKGLGVGHGLAKSHNLKMEVALDLSILSTINLVPKALRSKIISLIILTFKLLSKAELENNYCT